MGSYRERLLVPVSYWLLAVPVVVSLGAEAYFFVDGFIPPLVIGLLAVIVAIFLVHWSAATIEVTGGVLRAGRDTLALSEAGEVIALDERQAAQLRGPQADPAAHLLLRPYLKRAVYVGLADPGDGRAVLAGGDQAPGGARGRDRGRRAGSLTAASRCSRHGSRGLTGSPWDDGALLNGARRMTDGLRISGKKGDGSSTQAGHHAGDRRRGVPAAQGAGHGVDQDHREGAADGPDRPEGHAA